MFINHRSHDHISEEYATQTLYHLRIKTRGSECMVPWKTWVSENYGRSREFRKHLWWFSSAISRFRVIFCVSRLGMFHQTERKGLGASFFFFKSLVFRFHGHNSSNWARIEDHRRQCRATPWARGGTPLYKPYRYVPPQRAGLLGLFGLKTCLHFTHFGLESGMVFEGTTEAYERIYRSKSKWIRKK